MDHCKVILFTLAVPDRTGASKMVLSLSRRFMLRGYEVHVAHGASIKDERNKEFILYELHESGCTLHSISALSNPVGFAAFKEVSKLGGNIDAISVIGVNQMDRPIAMHAAHTLGVPGFIAGQNQHRFYGNKFMRLLKKARYKYFIKRYLTLAICTSGKVLSEFRKDFEVAEDRLVVVPNGIDPEKFRGEKDANKQQVREEFGVKPDEVLFVTTGRLTEQKGYDLLVQAVASVAKQGMSFKVLMIGGQAPGKLDEYRKKLEGMCDELGVSQYVIFAGWREDVHRLAKAGDIYVQSSRWEGPPLPLAAMEGMAAGLPAVITDCSGWPEGFVENEHGFVAKTGDISDLAEKLLLVGSKSKEELDRMGQSASDLILQRYNTSVTGDRFVDYVEETLKTG